MKNFRVCIGLSGVGNLIVSLSLFPARGWGRVSLAFYFSSSDSDQLSILLSSNELELVLLEYGGGEVDALFCSSCFSFSGLWFSWISAFSTLIRVSLASASNFRASLSRFICKSFFDPFLSLYYSNRPSLIRRPEMIRAGLRG